MLIDELRAISNANSNEMYSVLRQMCFDEANKGNYELERYFDLSGGLNTDMLIDFDWDLRETKRRFSKDGVHFEYQYLDDSDKEVYFSVATVNKVRVNIEWKY